MRARMEAWLTTKWYQKKVALSLMPLLPFAWLFRIVSSVRRVAYQALFSYRSSLPVIVVGNITAGGTGKTPFVLWLIQQLRQMGMQPGVILRGVGREQASNEPIIVTSNSKVSAVGDEALLLAKNSHAPIVVCRHRVNAAKVLERIGSCNIIISDDGLQHYALQRDIEIALVDATRQFGNQHLLPIGPLREPISRLNEVDFVVENGVYTSQLGFAARYTPRHFVSVLDNNIKKPLDHFRDNYAHGVAGIGHPQQFLAMLKKLELNVIPHVFPDHYVYKLDDLAFTDELPIIMTEKDAVKCKELLKMEELEKANSILPRTWYLEVQLECDARLIAMLMQKLEKKKMGVNPI